MPNIEKIDRGPAMTKQLELRAYSREEIALVLGVDLKDTNHFKRNIEAKLNKWGYSYEYSRKAVTITRAPTSAYERLAEIMIRNYDMDIRIDTFAFSTFLYSLVVFPEFVSMPWEERAIFLKDEFNVEVSDRTLRSWCARFFESGTLIKNNDIKTRWVTSYVDGEKCRMLVDGDPYLEQAADTYFKDFSNLMKTYKDLPKKERWDIVHKTLWDKYHCCYYSCKGISFSAWDDVSSFEVLQEMIELVNEIAEKEPVNTTVVINQTLEASSVTKEGEFKF